MKGTIATTVLVIVIIVVLALLSGIMFTVSEIEFAVVTQFGKPVRTLDAAGLYFKLPFMQDVIKFEKRMVFIM